MCIPGFLGARSNFHKNDYREDQIGFWFILNVVHSEAVIYLVAGISRQNNYRHDCMRESLCAPNPPLTRRLLHDNVPVAPKVLHAIEDPVVTIVLDEAAVGNQILGTVCDAAVGVEYHALSVLPFEKDLVS